MKRTEDVDGVHVIAENNKSLGNAGMRTHHLDDGKNSQGFKKEDYILGQVIGEHRLETRFGLCKLKTHSDATSISIRGNIHFICTPISCLKNTNTI
jgi:hypothetical protein